MTLVKEHEQHKATTDTPNVYHWWEVNHFIWRERRFCDGFERPYRGKQRDDLSRGVPCAVCAEKVRGPGPWTREVEA